MGNFNDLLVDDAPKKVDDAPNKTNDFNSLLVDDGQSSIPEVSLTTTGDIKPVGSPDPIPYSVTATDKKELSFGKKITTPTLEALVGVTKKNFEENPIFKDKKNRDIYFNTLSKKYDPGTIESLRSFTEREYEHPVVSTLMSPYDTFIEGVPAGLKKTGEGIKQTAEALGGIMMVPGQRMENVKAATKGAIKTLSGAAETGMAAIAPLPAVQPIMMGFHAIQGTPVEAAIMPVSTGIQKYYEGKGINPPEWASDLGVLADLAWGGALGLGAKKLIGKGSVKPQDITDALNETFKDPKDLNAIVESGGDPVVANIIKQKSDLTEALANPEISDQIKGDFIMPAIEAANQNIIVELGTKTGHNTAEATTVATLEHLKDQQSKMPEGARGALQPAIDELQAKVESFNPAELKNYDALKTESDQILAKENIGAKDLMRLAELDEKIAVSDAFIEQEISKSNPELTAKITEVKGRITKANEVIDNGGSGIELQKAAEEIANGNKELLGLLKEKNNLRNEIKNIAPESVQPITPESTPSVTPESKAPEIPGTPITEDVPTTPIKEPDIKPKVEGVVVVPEKKEGKVQALWTELSNGKTALKKAEEENMSFQDEMESERYIAENSENPSELASAYIREAKRDKAYSKDYIKEIIDQEGLTMRESDYKHYGDKNTKNFSIAKKYFRKDARPLDVQAQEMSEAAGVTITPQDLIDYIAHEQYSRGENQTTSRTTLQQKLKNKYAELTGGRDLTPKEAKQIIEHDTNLNIKNYERFIEQEFRSAAEAERAFDDAIRNGEIIIENGQVVNTPKGSSEISKPNATPPGEEGGINKSTNGKENDQKGRKEGLLSEPTPEQQGAVTPLSETKADTTPPKSDTTPPKTSLELAKEKLRLAKERAAKLRDNTNLGTATDPFEKTKQQAIADREVLDGYINVAKEYIKEGIKTVEEFAKAIGEKVEDVKKAWDFAEKGEVYGIKVDMLDEAVKDALHDKGDRRKFEDVETEARRKVAIGEIRPEEMIAKINSGEKYLPNGEDIIALIDHKVNLEKQRSEIKQRFDEAQDQGVKNKIQGELDVVNDKLFQWDEMAIRTAADQSQAFRFRQLMRDNEFNAVKAIRDWKAEDKNGTIPAEMEAKIKEWAEKFKALNEELAKKDQELTLEKEGRAEDNMKAEAEREKLKNKTTPQRKSSLSPEKAQRLSELAPKFKGRFLTGEKILTDFFDAEWREYAKLTFEEMAGDFKLFSKAIISNVGKKIAPFLRDIYKEVGGTDEGIFGASKPFLNKKGDLEVPHSLIRALVESGVEKIEDITKAVHAMVKDEFPGIGETKVRDTITKYGLTRNPNPDVIEGKIALAKRIGRKLSSVERLKKGKNALKSGLIPVDITPIERKLNREIRNLQKLLPKTQEEIAKVWKTAIDRTETRLKHQIEDLDIAIKTATKMVKADGRPTPDTPEINKLRDRKAALQKKYDETFGKNAHEITDAERVERAINALERESKNIEKDIKNGEISYRKTKSLPVNETLKKVRERNKALKDELAALRKEEGLAAAKEMEMRKDANVRYILKQRERIKNKEFDPKPKKSFEKDNELLDILVQRRKVKQEWETAREKHRLEQRTLAEQWYETWRDIWGGTKSAITSLDVSAAGRQGLPLSVANPAMAKKAMKIQFEHMFSQKKADRWLAELQNKPIYQLMKDSKLYISEPTSKLLAKEESFASNFAEKIPWIKTSERAYVGYLNSIRTDVFEKMVGVLKDQGKTWEKNPQAFKDAAKFINDFTGRGPMNENLAKVLSDPIIGMFSPRYVASRFSFFNPKNYLNPKIDKVVRQERIKSTVKFMGAVAAVLALAKYSGVADVNLDPTNTDFLKIKIGNKRIDILAGYSQVFGFMAKMVAEAYKQIKYKQTGVKPEGGTNEEGLLKTAGHFYRGKMTPVGSAATDLYMGEDIIGDKTSVAGEAAGLVTPLVVRDIYDLYKKEGAGWSAGLAIPLLFGFPTTSYGTTDKIWEVTEMSPEGNKVNVLGEQIDPKVYESNKGKEISDVWKFLDKYGGRPVFPKKSDLDLKDENGKNRAPTNEESYNYIVRSGEFIKEELKDLMYNGRKDDNSEYTDEETGETKYTYTDISLLTPEEQKKEIKKAITRGKERAKKELFEEKKTVLTED